MAQEKKGRVIWGLAAAIGLVALPFVIEYAISPYYLYLTIKIIVWALFAMSFNLVLGYGGMMSFGHAAFFGSGAYACALLLVKTSCPTVLAFLAAPLVAALIGIVVGYLPNCCTYSFTSGGTLLSETMVYRAFPSPLPFLPWIPT
jgi:branched-chain amino acid transport system permease protein